LLIRWLLLMEGASTAYCAYARARVRYFFMRAALRFQNAAVATLSAPGQTGSADGHWRKIYSYHDPRVVHCRMVAFGKGSQPFAAQLLGSSRQKSRPALRPPVARGRSCSDTERTVYGKRRARAHALRAFRGPCAILVRRL